MLARGAQPQDLVGRRVVISAGGTREPLDPVRFLGNRSSGKQGVALAETALARGAQVTLVAANVDGSRAGRRRPWCGYAPPPSCTQAMLTEAARAPTSS